MGKKQGSNVTYCILLGKAYFGQDELDTICVALAPITDEIKVRDIDWATSIKQVLHQALLLKYFYLIMSTTFWDIYYPHVKIRNSQLVK